MVRVGRDVTESCGVDLKGVSASKPRGVFTAEAPVHIRDVGPDEATDVEEPDGI